MNKILEEILEIPARGNDFWSNTPSYSLPLGVPYLGMGSSYFAPLAFKYMGVNISPELASEYFTYLSNQNKKPYAVILSQSGRSSEALWCTNLFEQYTALTNDPTSELAHAGNVKEVISILAGVEHYSSSKTYTNMLLTLFKGFDMDASIALQVLSNRMSAYQEKGEQMANEVFKLLQSGNIHGIYITGSGPNVATAMEAALILSESTKRNFHGLPMAQYDHGPKETARGSILIQILAQGQSYNRALKLSEKIRHAGAHVIHVEEPGVTENLSVVNNIVPFNFMAFYLAQKLNAGETFTIGGKVTEVE
jgi:glucosamine--fructose-6-phosphate aminotransferase (isomerizing)